MAVIKEKSFIDRFLKELIKDNGVAAYGEETAGKTLNLARLTSSCLSSNLRKSRLKIESRLWTYAEEKR